MSMVCPQCNGSFEQRLQCPTCAVRLLYQATSRTRGGGPAGSPEQWQHTPWGRIVIGLLLAQGLYHGLRQLCTAGLVAVADQAAGDVWTTLFGIVLQQGLMGFGLVVGGMLAGAGQRRGLILGTVVGLWNGVILVILENLNGRPLTTVAAYGEPLLLSAFGALGGLAGSLVWKPLPTLVVPAPERKSGLKISGPDKPSPFAGPVAWARVVLGITVAVGGSLWANVILNFVLEASEGKLEISSHLQAQLVTLEICALAIVFGSSLAGATTANGLKQGLCVGLGAGAILLGIQLGSAKVPINLMIFTVAGTSCLSLAGGWFGGLLFPPVVSLGRRRKVHAATAF
jgi:hypothetical protein